VQHLRDLIYRLRQGQSDRAVARDTGLSRLTVRKYHERANAAGWLDPATPLPGPPTLAAALGPPPQPPRTPSTVAPYQALVEAWRAAGVALRTIYDRLAQHHGYTGSYSSVRRFVRQLHPPTPRVTVRVHSAPGEEAQVDCGAAGRLWDPVRGCERPAYVFVMTLSFSRHQYAELVLDQTVRTWLACHRHAFAHFGGVPKRLVPDTLKAAVLVAALHDPVLGEAYRRLAQHYGCLISPTRPHTPEHKGKVENGVRFVKRSFLAGQRVTDVVAAHRQLRVWVLERAGTREHGTTHQAPLALFLAEEQAQLLPLPAEPFGLVALQRVKRHPDCHVVLDASYYSAPSRYVGEHLEACIYEGSVQLFRGPDLLTTHPRATRKGEWHTRPEHYPPEKAAYLQQTPQVCREQARRLGPATSQVVERLLGERPLDRRRAVQAILRLARQVGPQRLEAACQRALHFGDPRYRRIKDILNAALDQQPLPATARPAAPPREYAFARPVQDFFRDLVLAC
jgi:transposase